MKFLSKIDWTKKIIKAKLIPLEKLRILLVCSNFKKIKIPIYVHNAVYNTQNNTRKYYASK